MFWYEGLCANDALSYIPHGALTHLDAETVRASNQITFEAVRNVKTHMYINPC